MARAASGTTGEARDLARMRRRLVEWRESHARGVAFPNALWSAAGRVAQRHGVHVTARALGLEYNKLKRASGGVIAQGRSEARRPPKATRMRFIEVTGMVPASACGWRVSLQGRTVSGCNGRWHRARRPRWFCSCAGQVGVHPGDPAHRADAHSGGGGEHRLSRRYRWIGTDLPGTARSRSFLRLAGGVLQSPAHGNQDFDLRRARILGLPQKIIAGEVPVLARARSRPGAAGSSASGAADGRGSA